MSSAGRSIPKAPSPAQCALCSAKVLRGEVLLIFVWGIRTAKELYLTMWYLFSSSETRRLELESKLEEYAKSDAYL